MSAIYDRTAEGTDTVALGHEDGHVFLIFEKPVKWVKLDPITAAMVANQMATDGYHAKYGDTPGGQSKSVIADQKRIILVRRVEKMIQAMQNAVPATHPQLQAQAVVDAMLQEVF